MHMYVCMYEDMFDCMYMHESNVLYALCMQSDGLLLLVVERLDIHRHLSQLLINAGTYIHSYIHSLRYSKLSICIWCYEYATSILQCWYLSACMYGCVYGWMDVETLAHASKILMQYRIHQFIYRRWLAPLLSSLRPVFQLSALPRPLPFGACRRLALLTDRHTIVRWFVHSL